MDISVQWTLNFSHFIQSLGSKWHSDDAWIAHISYRNSLTSVNVGVFRGYFSSGSSGIFYHHITTTVDSWWMYWRCCPLLSTKFKRRGDNWSFFALVCYVTPSVAWTSRDLPREENPVGSWLIRTCLGIQNWKY